MPLIQIDLDSETFAQKHDEIDAAVRRALSTTIGSLDSEVVVLFSPYDDEPGERTRFNSNFDGRGGQIILTITLVRFFSVNTKQELYYQLLLELAGIGIKPEDVHMPLIEYGAEDTYPPAA